MELVNELYTHEAALAPATRREVLEKIVLLLAPFAPFICEEMWEEMGRTGPVFKQPWPVHDESLAQEEGDDIVLQVNGKVRSRVMAPLNASKDELENLALADERVKSLTEGKAIIKIVAVPGKLVNVVVKG